MGYRPPEKWTHEACLEESKKYKTRTEFKKGCVGAYDKSCKMKWIDEFTWLAAPSNKKYTFEEVLVISEQYSTLAEFTKNSFGAYDAARKNGWLDKLTHLKRRNADFTVETIIEDAKKFDSYSDFIKSNESEYNAFLKLYNSGKIKDEDLPWEVTKRKSEWTHDDCYNEAKKYDSLWHFKLGNESAYNRARLEGWLDEYTWFRNQRKYTFEQIKEAAEKYDTLYEFQINNGGMYGAAKANGWLEQFENLKRRKLYTPEEVVEFCKGKTKKQVVDESCGIYGAYLRFLKTGQVSDSEINWQHAERTQGDALDPIHSVYVYDFGDYHAYVGRTYQLRRRDNQHRRPHVRHGKASPDSILQYSIESGIPVPEMEILEDGLTMQESCRQEDFWKKEYEKMGYIMLNKGTTGEFSGSVGGFVVKWTKESIVEEAKKYSCAKDFREKSEGAYRAAMRLKIMDELFPGRMTHNEITLEKAKEAAATCSGRGEFSKKYASMYIKARENNWLDILFPKTNSETLF